MGWMLRRAQRRLAGLLGPDEVLLAQDAVVVQQPPLGTCRAYVTSTSLHLNSDRDRSTLVTIPLGDVVLFDANERSLGLRTKAGTTVTMASQPRFDATFLSTLRSMVTLNGPPS